MTSTYPAGKAFFDAHGDDPDQVSGLMGRAIRRNGEIGDGPWTAVNNVYTPAGGLVTSAEDMTKYMLFLLNGGVHEGHRLITEKMLAELWAPQMIERSPYTPQPRRRGERLRTAGSSTNFPGTSSSNTPARPLALRLSHWLPKGVSASSYRPARTTLLVSDQMVSALKLAALEYDLELEPHDWIGIFTALN